MIYNFDFWLTTYCQAKCRSCARTNQDTGEEADFLVPSHMKLETFENRLKGFPHEIGYIYNFVVKWAILVCILKLRTLLKEV